MTELNFSVETIKYKLRLAGWTLSDLASHLNVKQGTISNVIAGRRKSQRIQTFLAEQLQTTPELLFSSNSEQIKKETVQ